MHEHDHAHHHEHGHAHCHDESCGHCHTHDEHGALSCGVGGCGCGHEHGHSHGEGEERGERVRLLVAAGIFVLSFLPVGGLFQPALQVTSILVAGYSMLWSGLKGLVRLRLDEMTLMTIAVVVAILLGEFFEAAMVTLLFCLGEMLEDLAVGRSRRNIDALTKIRPETANLVGPDGSSAEAPARSVPVGAEILVRPGERVPLDCIVLQGASQVDTSALTGESVLQDVQQGDSLSSGMVNTSGLLRCRTTSLFEDSAASRILRLVEESSAKKGKTEAFITRFAKVYTPVVVVLALALAFIPPLLGLGDFPLWIGRALVFLVSSCPCALVISVPLSFFAGIGAGSSAGVLVKGSQFIETLSKAQTVAMDKTGTLTTGRLVVSEHRGIGISDDALLQLAAACEAGSTHPVAQAIAARGDNNGPQLRQLQELPGLGVQAELEGQTLLCGSRRLMEQRGVSLQNIPSANVYLARDGILLGWLRLSDTPRDDARQTIADLKEAGVSRVVMLTGDGEFAAQTVGQAVGMDEVHASLLPADKANWVERSCAEGSVTLFVGDGINDSPVLARADAGIAMGLGSDAAIEAADVVLVSDRLHSLVDAIQISRRTMGVARFNIAFALTIKFAVLILGSLGMVGMAAAVFADVGVTVLAVLNSTRLLAGRKASPSQGSPLPNEG